MTGRSNQNTFGKKMASRKSEKQIITFETNAH